MCRNLRDKISLSPNNDFWESVEEIYSFFLKEFEDKDLRPLINGKFVYIDFKRKTDDKPDIFWHLIGLDRSRHKFQILPCINTETQKYCNKNCMVSLYQKQGRNICLYRGIRIPWIVDVLHIYNDNPGDPRLKWYVEEREGRNRLKICYHDDSNEVINFIVILEEFKDMYKLITGYIMFYENSINEVNRKSSKYHNKRIL